MSRSDWFQRHSAKLGFAFALIVAATAIGLGWNYGLWQERTYEQEARQAHADQAENGCYEIAEAEVQSSTIKKPNSKPCAPDEKAKEENDNRRDYADLVAQRSSALWAKIMGIAALIGMGLSLVGVALVWTTFRETRKANEIAKADERPWLNFAPGIDGHITICFDTLDFNISVSITNHGGRPANDVYGKIEATLDKFPDRPLAEISKAMLKVKADDAHVVTVFPTDSENLVLEGQFSISGISAGQPMFIIAIAYNDPALTETFYTARFFELHHIDASVKLYGSDGPKLLFHGQQNCRHILKFDLIEARQVAPYAS